MTKSQALELSTKQCCDQIKTLNLTIYYIIYLINVEKKGQLS